MVDQMKYIFYQVRTSTRGVSANMGHTELGEWKTPQDLLDHLKRVCSLEWIVPESAEHRLPFKLGYWMFGSPIKKIHRSFARASKYGFTTIVVLFPAHSDSQWFQIYIYEKEQVLQIKGRLEFFYHDPYPPTTITFHEKQTRIKNF